MTQTIVYFDLETGGLERKHPNIQIAAVAMRGSREVGWLDRKIRFDEHGCDPEALEINSYDPDTWERDAVSEAVATHDFLSFLRTHSDTELTSKRTGRPYRVAQLGGHNIATFDIPRLRDMAGRAFIPACWWYPLDTYHRAIWWFQERGGDMPADYKLTTLAEYFGIDAGDAHDALADVRMSAAIAEAMKTR